MHSNVGLGCIFLIQITKIQINKQIMGGNFQDLQLPQACFPRNPTDILTQRMHKRTENEPISLKIIINIHKKHSRKKERVPRPMFVDFW